MSLRAAWGRQGFSFFTFFSDDCQCDGDPGIFDQLNNAVMAQFNNGLPIHCRDVISDFQLSTAVSWTSFYDTANFMRNNYEKKTQVFQLRYLSVLGIIIIFII